MCAEINTDNLLKDLENDSYLLPLRSLPGFYMHLKYSESSKEIFNHDEFTPVRPIVSKLSTDIINWHKPLIEYIIAYVKEYYSILHLDSLGSHYGILVNDMRTRESMKRSPYQNALNHFGLNFTEGLKIR